MMYNHCWYKIVSQAMIDSLLRQYNYDSIMSNFSFIDSSDDNTINSELIKRSAYNKNIINYCAITKTTPIQSQYTNYYYTLIKQRRNLNDNGIQKFTKI